jgi:hypothetical protein
VRTWLAIVSCVVFAVAFPKTATPCTCTPLDVAHVGAELKDATLVFIGQVRVIEPIAATETGPRARYRVILEVTRRWKGPESSAYGVTAGPMSPADLCVARFERGATYLVFAFGDHVASCRAWKQGGPAPFASVGSIASMETVVRELDRLSAPEPATSGERPETVNGPLLSGIASLVVGASSIEVAQDSSLPSGLELRTATVRAPKATVKVGETFEITDGHHYGYSYKLLAIEKGTAKIEITPWTAFLGQEPTQSTSTMSVRSYVTRRKE